MNANPEDAFAATSQVTVSSQDGTTIKGDVVGRDKVIQGLDIGELVEALRQAFPSGDPRPERLSGILRQFQRFHAELHEWKELHNELNELIDSFDQFATLVVRTQATDRPLDPLHYRDQFGPVSRRVSGLLAWAAGIRMIGRPRDDLVGEPRHAPGRGRDRRPGQRLALCGFPQSLSSNRTVSAAPRKAYGEAGWIRSVSIGGLGSSVLTSLEQGRSGGHRWNRP